MQKISNGLYRFCISSYTNMEMYILFCTSVIKFKKIHNNHKGPVTLILTKDNYFMLMKCLYTACTTGQARDKI